MSDEKIPEHVGVCLVTYYGRIDPDVERAIASALRAARESEREAKDAALRERDELLDILEGFIREDNEMHCSRGSLMDVVAGALDPSDPRLIEYERQRAREVYCKQNDAVAPILARYGRVEIVGDNPTWPHYRWAKGYPKAPEVESKIEEARDVLRSRATDERGKPA